ncbi:MAG: cryptochrome/photolyase family protein [Sphingomonadales bacterium]
MTSFKQPLNIFWFRRDLRLDDNNGLFQALKAGLPVKPIFIFDREILDKLDNPNDRRVLFIHKTLSEIKLKLQSMGSDLWVFYGNPNKIWVDLLKNGDINTVYTNKDYEPYAIARDKNISDLCATHGINFLQFKDQVVFECAEVVKDDGLPYTVYTPYSRRWKAQFRPEMLNAFASESLPQNFLQAKHCPIPSLSEMGFEETRADFPESIPDEEIIKAYAEQRDIPSLRGTTRMSVHLRFGTISIRKLTQTAMKLSEKYLNELIWREFYMQILWHFPRVVNESFKPKYDRIVWRNNEDDFKKWCQGQTGYPIVDAGMRELLATGFMHNRVRMIVASFLTKHLLIDWRWGEAWFARHLLDFELASNNGGWQWAAGSGVDAAPYFRVFNPHLQTLKFDPECKYIKKWVPEWNSLQYARPVIEHEVARKRCLAVYQKAVGPESAA